jgi:D-mannonate dehydratase
MALPNCWQSEAAPGWSFLSEKSHQMWANYDWYMDRILPVCEEAGVRMALHPDDPPVNYPLGGIPRLFRNFENLARAMERHSSPLHGLDFCHGCWSEMRGGEGYSTRSALSSMR